MFQKTSKVKKTRDIIGQNPMKIESNLNEKINQKGIRLRMFIGELTEIRTNLLVEIETLLQSSTEQSFF